MGGARAGNLVGLDAEDVVRGFVKPIAQGARGKLVHRVSQLFKRVEAPSVGARSLGSSPGGVSVMNEPCLRALRGRDYSRTADAAPKPLLAPSRSLAARFPGPASLASQPLPHPFM